MDAVDGDAARAVRGARLPERARVTRANAERLGTEQQFWCTTKCFVRDVLEAREIAIVDDASDGGGGARGARGRGPNDNSLQRLHAAAAPPGPQTHQQHS